MAVLALPAIHNVLALPAIHNSAVLVRAPSGRTILLQTVLRKNMATQWLAAGLAIASAVAAVPRLVVRDGVWPLHAHPCAAVALSSSCGRCGNIIACQEGSPPDVSGDGLSIGDLLAEVASRQLRRVSPRDRAEARIDTIIAIGAIKMDEVLAGINAELDGAGPSWLERQSRRTRRSERAHTAARGVGVPSFAKRVGRVSWA